MDDVKSKTPFVVGLTGGIASGKSTVADIFSRLGAEVIDADAISRILVAPGTQGLAAIAARFGASLLEANGELDRSRLKQIIFDNEAERHWLENLLHPQVREAIEAAVHTSEKAYAIVMVPLLLESGHYDFVNRVLVVDVPESIQVSRCMQRDKLDREAVMKIMASQMPRSRRLELADDIIDNTVTLSTLEQEVRKLDEFYRQHSSNADQAG